MNEIKPARFRVVSPNLIVPQHDNTPSREEVIRADKLDRWVGRTLIAVALFVIGLEARAFCGSGLLSSFRWF